jgi:hypothetical protein
MPLAQCQPRNVREFYPCSSLWRLEHVTRRDGSWLYYTALAKCIISDAGQHCLPSSSMTTAPFDIAAWLREDNTKRPVQVKRPCQITCWTRQSSTHGGAYLYGDTSGDLGGQDRFHASNKSTQCSSAPDVTLQ